MTTVQNKPHKVIRGVMIGTEVKEREVRLYTLRAKTDIGNVRLFRKRPKEKNVLFQVGGIVP